MSAAANKRATRSTSGSRADNGAEPLTRTIGGARPRVGRKLSGTVRAQISALVARALAAAGISASDVSDSFNDLVKAAEAIDAWIDAAGPLRQKVADALAVMRNLVAAKAPSASDISGALDSLEGAGTAIDVWLDAAGPLRQQFANAVSAFRTCVGASVGSQTVETSEAPRSQGGAHGGRKGMHSNADEIELDIDAVLADFRQARNAPCGVSCASVTDR